MNPTDDILGSDGATYHDQDYQSTIPHDQLIEFQEQTSMLASSYPIMQDVIAWFETQIDHATHTDDVILDTMTINGVTIDRKVSIEAQVLAQRLLRTKLENKFSEFKDLKES